MLESSHSGGAGPGLAWWTVGVGFCRHGGFPRASDATWWEVECRRSCYWYGKVDRMAEQGMRSYDLGDDTRAWIGEIKRHWCEDVEEAIDPVNWKGEETHRFSGLVKWFVVTSFVYLIFFSIVFLVGEGKYSMTVVLLKKIRFIQLSPTPPILWVKYTQFSPNTFNAMLFVINLFCLIIATIGQQVLTSYLVYLFQDHVTNYNYSCTLIYQYGEF